MADHGRLTGATLRLYPSVVIGDFLEARFTCWHQGLASLA